MREPWCPISRMDCQKPHCRFWAEETETCLVYALIVNILAQMPMGGDEDKEEWNGVLETDQGEVAV